jgi:hypothetical protein
MDEIQNTTDLYRAAPTGPAANLNVCWDLEAEGGPAEYSGPSAHIQEMVARGRGRYVHTLPSDKKPGPLSGHNRIRLS